MTDNRRRQHDIDAAGWNVFARHQPDHHVLSDPRMLNPDREAQAEFWGSGVKDVDDMMAFGGWSPVAGLGVDFGCGLGRLTRALTAWTDRQIGLDISSEMIGRAQELNAAYPTCEFRLIDGIQWPVDTECAALVVSHLVFHHLSNVALMEHSLREIGRVLQVNGRAVFGLQTMTWRGEWVHAIQRLFATPSEPRQQQIRARLAGERPGGKDFTEDEIFTDLFQMEFRRMKSMPLRALSASLRASRLKVCRLSRNRSNGATRVAVEKV